MKKFFRAYYVWPRFPSLSMSGGSCSLSCKHCNHVYLHDMQTCTDSAQLLRLCKKISEADGVGVLLSGGCNTAGEMLNLRKLLPIIKKVKAETGLIIKLHTGFVDLDLAQAIADAGVDIASMECIGADETIQEIFGLPVTVDKYTETFENLQHAGVPHIVPHICIGLHHGQLLGEQKALELLKEVCDPSVLVFIVLRPTHDTKLAGVGPPTPDQVEKIVTVARQMFPDIDLSLGCMRPRSNGRDSIELAALKAGVTRMEIPAKKTLEAAEAMGYQILEIQACCALPEALEENALKR